MNFESPRREVFAICLKLADRGYIPGTGGNVALRIDDEHFAVTPSSIDYYLMQPEDICVLRIGDLRQVAGERKPSIEHRFHAHVLRERRDCQASIHTHQPIASAFSLLGRDLLVQDPNHRLLLGERVALVAYAPSGTNWLAANLLRALQPGVHAYLLCNHGALCCAPTLDKAFARVEALESACADFFRQAIGSHMGQLPPAEIFSLFEDKEFGQ
jgi:L-fuculose-phosphate aldolase